MNKLQAILEMLAKEPAAKLALLAKNPAMTANYLSTAYLMEPEEMAPDSQESEEAATLEGQYLADAALEWRGLKPETQQGLLEAARKLGGETLVTNLQEALSTTRAR